MYAIRSYYVPATGGTVAAPADGARYVYAVTLEPPVWQHAELAERRVARSRRLQAEGIVDIRNNFV